MITNQIVIKNVCYFCFFFCLILFCFLLYLFSFYFADVLKKLFGEKIMNGTEGKMIKQKCNQKMYRPFQ